MHIVNQATKAVVGDSIRKIYTSGQLQNDIAAGVKVSSLAYPKSDNVCISYSAFSLLITEIKIGSLKTIVVDPFLIYVRINMTFSILW